jgi:hypothetical protein
MVQSCPLAATGQGPVSGIRSAGDGDGPGDPVEAGDQSAAACQGGSGPGQTPIAGADLRSAASGVPRRPGDAGEHGDDLPVAVRAVPGRVEIAVDGVSAHRTGTAASQPQGGAREEPHPEDGQRLAAAAAGERPGRTRQLGGGDLIIGAGTCPRSAPSWNGTRTSRCSFRCRTVTSPIRSLPRCRSGAASNVLWQRPKR